MVKKSIFAHEKDQKKTLLKRNPLDDMLDELDKYVAECESRNLLDSGE
jgi:hypothetical protein